jgi:hypothetical protein
MSSLVKAFDDLPVLVKFLLALPGIDGLAWGIYRLAKGIHKKNLTLIIAGIVWIFMGFAILWIVDLICIAMYKKVTIFAE